MNIVDTSQIIANFAAFISVLIALLVYVGSSAHISQDGSMSQDPNKKKLSYSKVGMI